MKIASKIAALAALTAAAGLGACADDYAYGPGRAYADVGYSVWYDGYYGPFTGGYWGPSGAFYYWDSRNHHYRRDHGGHFRREGAQGFSRHEGRAPPPARRGPLHLPDRR